MDVVNAVADFLTVDTPSYYQASQDYITGFKHCLKHCDVNGTWELSYFIDRLAHYSKWEFGDAAAMLSLAAFWTLLRVVLTKLVYLPYARWVQLRPVDMEKFPESAWKLLVYCVAWSFTCWVVFGHEEFSGIFYDHLTMFDDFAQLDSTLGWQPRMDVPWQMYWIYMLQMAFYLHSVFGTLFMDVWRKDSIVMLFHHILTMSLIGFSFATRFYKIGALVLFLHDITDICLEFTKCNVYLKNRGGKYHALNDRISTVGFVAFACTWFLFRLYWFPLKCLHASLYGSMLTIRKVTILPFYFFFNAMLFCLLILNLWWFSFIMSFLYKVLTGQITEVDDVREEDVCREVIKPLKTGASKAKSNGKKSKKAD